MSSDNKDALNSELQTQMHMSIGPAILVHSRTYGGRVVI